MARTANQLKFATFANFPAVGGTGILYIATDTNTIYRWTGSAYVMVWDGTWTWTVTQINTAWLLSGWPITSTGTITTSMATNKLAGRWTAWTGVMEEITLGTGLSLTGNTLNASGGIDWTLVANRLVLSLDTDTITTDSAFVSDSTNDRIGIQAATPQVPLHVVSATGTTLNNVTVGNASLVAETLPNIPTGSITQIVEPAAWSGGSASYVNGGSGTAITANGSSYDFRISPCLYVASLGTFYRSQFYETVSAGTDPNDSQWYDISLSWWTVTISGESVYYFVEYDINGWGSWQPIGLYPTTSELLTNLSGSNSTTPFPTYYNNTPWSPPTAFTGGSASGQDVGYGAFYEIPITVLMEVDSVLNIGGTDYVSGSPASGSFDDTWMGTYNPEISWTDNWGATNAIARVSQDNGSTWIYQYVGSTTSPYRFTSTSNDTAAEARWWQTYSGGVVNYYFTPHGQGSAPSGSTVYSVAGTQYSTALPADSQNYIFKHIFTGNTLGKTLENQINSYGQSYVSGEFYDVGYTTWSSGITVTPQSYGFTGTAQNRDYKIYSSGSGIYSIIPYTASTTSGSGSKSVSLSWTLPSGITTVKILRQVNGGGYTVSKTISGTSTTDDTTDNSWNGNTTVTPTSIVWGTARFDKALTTLTDEWQLLIVESGNTGTRYSKMSFGIATSSSAAASYQAHIYSTSSTGYLSMTTGRLEVSSSLGGTASTMFGNANIINNNSSSSQHFQVKGANDASLINTRSDMDTVWFWQAIGSDQQTTVQIQPARSSDAGLVMKWHASQSDSSTIIRTQTSAGTYTGEITVGGWMRTSTGAVGNPAHSCRSDTNTGLYFPASDVMGSVAGWVEQNRVDTGGTRIRWGTASSTFARVSGTLTASTTAVGNVGTGEDNLITYTVPGNLLTVNLDRIKFTSAGTFAANINNKRIRVYFGTTVLLDTTALALNGGDWAIDWEVIRTGAATQKAWCRFSSSNTLLTSLVDYTAPTMTLSSNQTFKLTGEATSNNDISQELLTIDYCPSN